MGRTNKDIREKTERVERNAVTGAVTVTVLDDVQRAYERCVQVIDGKLLTLDAAGGFRLVKKLLEDLRQKLPSNDPEARE